MASFSAKTPILSHPVHPSAFVRALAQFISALFHPLLVTSYVMGFLIYLHPSVFEGVEPHLKNLRMASVVLFTVFFPAITLFLARRLHLIERLSMDRREDRLVGFIVTMFFYFWTSYVFRNLPDTPPAARHFLLGTFLAVCAAWMATIFYKVSLHAVAIGGIIAFFLLLESSDPFASGLYLVLPILIGGLVGSARFIVGAHNRFEMLTGFGMGFVAQLVAWLF